MIISSDALTHNLLDIASNSLGSTNKEAHTNSMGGALIQQSQYFSNQEVQSKRSPATSVESDSVNISEDALRLFESEKLTKTKDSSSTGEVSSELLNELIEKTKEKIDKAEKELDKIIGNDESAKQERKALQAQVLMLHNQLLLLVSQKAEMLTKK